MRGLARPLPSASSPSISDGLIPFVPPIVNQPSKRELSCAGLPLIVPPRELVDAIVEPQTSRDAMEGIAAGVDSHSTIPAEILEGRCSGNQQDVGRALENQVSATFPLATKLRTIL
jgi:hypothetical protein